MTLTTIDADGPLYGGPVQFQNWPWPGYCMRGDTAGGWVHTLKFAARALEGADGEVTPTLRAAIAAELRDMANELRRCFVTLKE